MGKQALMYVVGLSMLIGIALSNLSDIGLNALDAFILRYNTTTVHSIAVAGANIGTSLCLADTAYDTDLVNTSFNGGTFSVTIVKGGDSTVVRSIGRLNVRYYDPSIAAIRTVLYDTVEAKLQRIFFCQYAYFSDKEKFNYLSPGSNTIPSPGGNADMYKITGDSIFGPVHTNDQWHFMGTPYFGGKITGNDVPYVAPGGNPVYAGGSEWGISVPRPEPRLDEIETSAQSGGKYWTSAQTGNQDLGLTFSSDGRVRVRIPWNTGATKDTTYGSIASLAPNGVIGVEAVDVRVTGTYQGRATVLARSGSAPLKGNVWIQGNIVAATDPQTNPASGDMLGLVAERMTYVATTGIARNASSQTYIQAAIYSQNGTMAVENYNTVPNSGRLNIYGSITGVSSTCFGVVSGGSLTNGMLRSHRFDFRFNSKSPPSFPFADKEKLVSWWEN